MADRFDKFTERARKVLQLAQEEAQRFNHSYLDAEHILLGLIGEGDGVAARVLDELNIDLDKARFIIEARIAMGQDAPVHGEIGLTPRAKRVIELALDEARSLNHHYIGAEHLLLGLVRHEESINHGLFENFKVSHEQIRHQVIQVLENSSGYQVPQSEPGGRDRFDKFTERARKVLQFAQEEALRFNHDYIGTEHILLGLVREGDSVAARVLNNLGIELHKVRSAVNFIIGRGDRTVIGDIGLTPRAKRVIELAVDEARRLNHQYIGTEHFLLGLVREGEGIAAGVLESLGVSLEKVRGEVIDMINSGPGKVRAVSGVGIFMDPALEHIKTMFDYSLWARDKLLGVIGGLETSSLKQSEVKGVYGSIHDTFAHLAASEWLWLQRCKGESPMETPKGEDFADLDGLVNWWDEVHESAMSFLVTITEADLEREITYSAADGKVRTRKVWHMLLHAGAVGCGCASDGPGCVFEREGGRQRGVTSCQHSGGFR